MALYIVGDIQGCYDELQRLLERAGFNHDIDTLWLTGDLVARGPKSLEVIRWVKSHPNFHTVLGNHDLHLLSIVEGIKPNKPKDKLQPILDAADRDEICHWLRQQPLLMTHACHKLVMTHAGIYPEWTMKKAKHLAREVESQLSGKHYRKLLKEMYGNHPRLWRDDLESYERWRFIINAMTRMRFCTQDGKLDFHCKTAPDVASTNLTPWFELHHKIQQPHYTIAFGHWAALMGKTHDKQYMALDTGCVWGNQLTVYNYDEHEFYFQNAL